MVPQQDRLLGKKGAHLSLVDLRSIIATRMANLRPKSVFLFLLQAGACPLASANIIDDARESNASY